jgi:hypothetical protein
LLVPSQVTVWTDGKGFSADWHLSHITVLNRSTSALQIFKHNGWIKTEQVVLASSEQGLDLSEGKHQDSHAGDDCAAGHASSGGPVVSLINAESRQITQTSKSDACSSEQCTLFVGPNSACLSSLTYDVLCHTSDIMFAGTSSPVMISLFGPDGKQLQDAAIQLKPARGGFTRNSLAFSTFQVPASADCGHPLSRVLVSLGQILIKDNWHLESLQISCLETGHTYKFSCGNWLGDKHGKEMEWCRDPIPSSTPLPRGLTLIDESVALHSSQQARLDPPQTPSHPSMHAPLDKNDCNASGGPASEAEEVTDSLN